MGISQKTIIAAALLTVCFGVFIPQAQAVTTDSYRTSLLAQIQQLKAEIIRLQKIIQSRQLSENFESIILDNSATVRAQYLVTDPSTLSWIKNTNHRALTGRFYELVPNQFDSKVIQIVFFADSEGGYDAFTETVQPYSLGNWRVGFNEEITKFSATDAVTTELLIHEFGHIVSFEAVYGKKYLEMFEQEFWNGKQSANQYVSEYARESAAEDFSETFATFVMNGIDYSVKGREKVDWFFEQDELVSVRADIRKNI